MPQSSGGIDYISVHLLHSTKCPKFTWVLMSPSIHSPSFLLTGTSKYCPPLQAITFLNLLSALLRYFFLCWSPGNGDMPPTLDAALLCSSRAVYEFVHAQCLEWDSNRLSRVTPLLRRAFYPQATTAGSSNHL